MAAVDPDIQWEVLETPHFSVVYDSRHKSLAVQYGVAAERAFSLLEPIFHQLPEKTTIYLDDSTDIANGAATFFPYPHIIANPVIPTLLDSITHHGNWSHDLITHEFTHIANMEPANGFYNPLRMIFGSIIHPNALLPRWYTEGLAVEMETRFSRHGRLRSPSQQAILRSMVADGVLQNEDISRINEAGIPSWPKGQRPYLFGSLLWENLLQTQGVDLAQTLNQRYSRRVPYLLNGPLEDERKMGYEPLLEKVYADLENTANSQIAKIRQEGGQFSFSKIPQEGFFNHDPVFSPNGLNLIYVVSPEDDEGRIEMVSRKNPKEEIVFSDPVVLTSAKGIQKLSWFPDNQRFVFDAIKMTDGFNSYSDLYLYDLVKKEKSQITKNLRAREPSVSPSGQWIAFVHINKGFTELAVVDHSGAQLRILYTPKGGRVSRPEFLNSEQIVFSERNLKGQEFLRKIDLVSNQTESLLLDYQPASFARRTKQGLLFVSDRTGVSNVYLAKPDAQGSYRSAQALTNSTTQATTGDLDPLTQDLVFSQMDSTGLQLAIAPAKNRKPLNPPEVSLLSKSVWPSFREPSLNYSTETDQYSAWKYLIPHYWYPYLYAIPDGAAFELVTGSADLLGNHAYSLIGSVDTLSQKPSGSFEYLFSYGKSKFDFSASDYYSYYYGSGLTSHSSHLGLNFSRPFPFDDTNWAYWVGAHGYSTDFGNGPIRRVGPEVGISYRDVKKMLGYQIFPTKGKTLSLGYTVFDPSLGNRSYDRTELGGSYYFSRWLPKNHVLYAKGYAVYSPRNPSQIVGIDHSVGYSVNRVIPETFLMRGYLSGNFRGRDLLNTSLEYHFPVSYLYRGWGTLPFFLKSIHAAVVADAVTLNGDYFSSTGYQATQTGRFFTGVGTEATLETTIGYHLPFSVVVGLYYGLDPEALGEFNSFVGVNF